MGITMILMIESEVSEKKNIPEIRLQKLPLYNNTPNLEWIKYEM